MPRACARRASSTLPTTRTRHRPRRAGSAPGSGRARARRRRPPSRSIRSGARRRRRRGRRRRSRRPVPPRTVGAPAPRVSRSPADARSPACVVDRRALSSPHLRSATRGSRSSTPRLPSSSQHPSIQCETGLPAGSIRARRETGTPRVRNPAPHRPPLLGVLGPDIAFPPCAPRGRLLFWRGFASSTRKARPVRFSETITPISAVEYHGFWGSFWDLIWWFLAVFIFISYLFVLFSVIGDLFRDRKLNGWAKAAWVIFLVFFPILTALVYLIVRGRGMGERSQAQAARYEEAQAAYIKSVAGQTLTPADEIAKAKALLDAGTISQAEFDRLKVKALG
ncbi:MAG: hypothetical protein IJO71_11965 [Microbacterium sp.]|nr:hypothetical protein [Microbacterium sp.]